jgi:hypothetical protein
MAARASQPPRYGAIAAPIRDEAAHELIAAMEARMVAVESELARVLARDSRPSLSRADRERLGRILPVIVGVLGSELFLVREVLASDHPGLRLVLRGLNAKRLGRLFRRATDQSIGAYVIRREGSEGGAVLWCIEAVLVSAPVKPGGRGADGAW